MSQSSEEQLAVVHAPLTSISVIACAGSGKTRTAVRRLAEIRKLLGDQRGRVALLSFSNVAVDTFTRSYQTLAREMGVGAGGHRVEIDTLDGFITRNVLHPHAFRTMGAGQAAYLVTGEESFLGGYNFWNGTYPVNITRMQVGTRGADIYFYYANNDQIVELDTYYASEIVRRLGRTGAYTHNLGRYWCYRTLQDQPVILRALARRYPHILIDEAQDIGTLHQVILEQLIGAGVRVSLIGDPNQGIYEFAGANGRFLANYGKRAGVTGYGLTRNYRSVPSILSLANRLSGRGDAAERTAPHTRHGAFFIAYKTADRETLITGFQAAVLAADLKIERSAVLCRGREAANKLAGRQAPVGQGLIKAFAQAALHRDKRQDYLSAFRLVASAITGLLADAPHGLTATITQPNRYPEARALRRLIWGFTRDSDTGLPSATLPADGQWHTQLLSRVKSLLAVLVRDHSLQAIDKLGNKLAKTGLTAEPLMLAGDLGAGDDTRIRIDTVHQVKGESLDAVLYLATKEHVAALLGGVNTEVGRIGYVAVTRARNLLWLGVPANALREFRPALLAHGLQEVIL